MEKRQEKGTQWTQAGACDKLPSKRSPMVHRFPSRQGAGMALSTPASSKIFKKHKYQHKYCIDQKPPGICIGNWRLWSRAAEDKTWSRLCRCHPWLVLYQETISLHVNLAASRYTSSIHFRIQKMNTLPILPEYTATASIQKNTGERKHLPQVQEIRDFLAC